jgi:hypothetical protein
MTASKAFYSSYFPFLLILMTNIRIKKIYHDKIELTIKKNVMQGFEKENYDKIDKKI